MEERRERKGAAQGFLEKANRAVLSRADVIMIGVGKSDLNYQVYSFHVALVLLVNILYDLNCPFSMLV